jgi:hypothetical protein
MTDDLRNHLEQIKAFLLKAKHSAEQAEAKVEQLNGIIHQVAAARLVPREVFLGATAEQPYDSESGRDDTGQVIQAALLIPGGFGVCRFDTEEYCALQRECGGVERSCRMKFTPFEQCDPAARAFLNDQINELFVKFSDFCESWSVVA